MSCYNFFLSFFYRILANFFSLKLTIAALPPFIMLLRRPRHLEVARWVLLLHEALSLVHQIFSSHLIRPVSSFFKWKIFALISLYLRLGFFFELTLQFDVPNAQQLLSGSISATSPVQDIAFAFFAMRNLGLTGNSNSYHVCSVLFSKVVHLTRFFYACSGWWMESFWFAIQV